ncbi:MAG: NifU family protein [Bacteroidota bacterium]
MEKTAIPTVVYAELTPNPATMKFVANRLLVPDGVNLEFLTKQQARPYSPLADDLFNFPFVKSVFITSNFITITKTDAIGWEMINLQLREYIRDFLQSNEKAVTAIPEKTAPAAGEEKTSTASVSTEPVEPSQYDEEIRKYLDEYVRPAVESDGGAIEFKSFKDGVVTLVLKGACSGCPSSTITLKQGIQTMLTTMMPDVIKEVVAEEG